MKHATGRMKLRNMSLLTPGGRCDIQPHTIKLRFIDNTSKFVCALMRAPLNRVRPNAVSRSSSRKALREYAGLREDTLLPPDRPRDKVWGRYQEGQFL